MDAHLYVRADGFLMQNCPKIFYRTEDKEKVSLCFDCEFLYASSNDLLMTSSYCRPYKERYFLLYVFFDVSLSAGV